MQKQKIRNKQDGGLQARWIQKKKWRENVNKDFSRENFLNYRFDNETFLFVVVVFLPLTGVKNIIKILDMGIFGEGLVSILRVDKNFAGFLCGN